MNYIRKIVNVNDLGRLIDVPSDMRDRYVEVIVLPVDRDSEKKLRTKKHSMLNVNLIKEESEAWSKLLVSGERVLDI